MTAEAVDAEVVDVLEPHPVVCTAAMHRFDATEHERCPHCRAPWTYTEARFIEALAAVEEFESYVGTDGLPMAEPDPTELASRHTADELCDMRAAIRDYNQVLEGCGAYDESRYLGAWRYAVASAIEIATARAIAAPTPPAPASLAPADKLPDGMAPWDGQERTEAPVVDPGVFAGPIGAFALDAAPNTEADPVAIFVQALVGYGAMCNRGAYIEAGNDRHGPSEFALIVGRTSSGGKGTSWGVSRSLLENVDDGFVRRRIMGGFGSGEAIVADLAPPEDENAPRDNRALIFESEFGGLLAKTKRDGSTVSEVIRNAWDGRPLANRTRTSGRIVATDYHLAALGHITAEELRDKLATVDVWSGFINRFLLVYAQRTQLLPDGGNVPSELIARHARTLRDNLAAVRPLAVMKRTPAAQELWSDIYHDLAADEPPGALGAAISRAAPHVLRLSLLYALSAGADAVDEDHVGAAFLLWNYARQTAGYIFGESTGNADADRLLAELRQATTSGLSMTEVRDLFGRHGTRGPDALRRLIDAGLAATVVAPTAGRPATIALAVRRLA